MAMLALFSAAFRILFVCSKSLVKWIWSRVSPGERGVSKPMDIGKALETQIKFLRPGKWARYLAMAISASKVRWTLSTWKKALVCPWNWVIIASIRAMSAASPADAAAAPAAAAPAEEPAFAAADMAACWALARSTDEGAPITLTEAWSASSGRSEE